jgi:hypothetical protein
MIGGKRQKLNPDGRILLESAGNDVVPGGKLTKTGIPKQIWQN